MTLSKNTMISDVHVSSAILMPCISASPTPSTCVPALSHLLYNYFDTRCEYYCHFDYLLLELLTALLIILPIQPSLKHEIIVLLTIPTNLHLTKVKTKFLQIMPYRATLLFPSPKDLVTEILNVNDNVTKDTTELNKTNSDNTLIKRIAEVATSIMINSNVSCINLTKKQYLY